MSFPGGDWVPERAVVCRKYKKACFRSYFFPVIRNRFIKVGDRDRSREDADAVVVPGVFSLSADTVYWFAGE